MGAAMKIRIFLIFIIAVHVCEGQYECQYGVKRLNNYIVDDSIHQSIQPGTGVNLRNQLILKDGTLSECSGEIFFNDGSCSGNLVPSTVDKSELCKRKRNYIGPWNCVELNGGIFRIIVHNDKVGCDNAVLVAFDEYQKECGFW